MSLTLVNHVRKQANLIGYKPRIGIEIPDLLLNFSRSQPFEVVLYSGSNGTTDSVADDTIFTSAGQTFDADNLIVLNSDVLVITSGVNAGEFPLTGIDSDTQLVSAGAGFTTTIKQNYQIIRRYQDMLTNYPAIKTYSKELGGYAPQSDLGFGVLNQELFSNIFATYPNPENSEVNVRLYFDDATDILLSESVLIYTGKIKTFPTTDMNAVRFSISDDTILKDRKIGTLVTSTDAADGQLLPEESLGKMKPIIYGDFTSDALGIDSDFTHDNNFVPAVYLGIDGTGKHRWLIADHQVDSVGEIWCWDSAPGRMVRLVAPTTEQNTSAGCIISHANFAPVYDYWFPENKTPNDTSVQGTPTYPNPENITDVSKTTKCVVTVKDGLGAGANDEVTLVVLFSDYDWDIISETGNNFYTSIVSKTDWDDGANAGNSVFDVHDWTYSTHNLKVHNSATLAYGTETLQTDIAVINDNVTFTMQGSDGFVANDNVADIYQCFKRIRYTPNKLLPVFFGSRGREYGTWINNRTVANGYTINHVDTAAGSGTMIGNGAGILESLLRDVLGMGSEASALPATDTDIFRDSFNIASNQLSTTAITLAITKQDGWIPTISTLSKALKSNSHFNVDNRMKMVVFNGTAGFSASGKTVPNNWDIYEDSPIKTFKIISGYNDRLHMTGADLAISAGEYTGASLAVEINANFVAEGSYPGIVLSYSSVGTGKFWFDDLVGYGGVGFNWTASSRQIGRFLGFDISADDTLPTSGTITGDFGLWADSWVENPIASGSIKLTKQSEDIITDITVNYNRDNGGVFQATTNTTDNTYHAEVIADIFEHDFTKDSATAIIYRDFLKDRLAKRHWMCSFKTFINAIHVEMWDVINIRHPLLAGMFTTATMNSKEWVVLDVSIVTGSMEVVITAIEV